MYPKMRVEHVRELVQHLQALRKGGDPLVAERFECEIYRLTLGGILHGDDNPSALAKEALKADESEVRGVPF